MRGKYKEIFQQPYRLRDLLVRSLLFSILGKVYNYIFHFAELTIVLFCLPYLTLVYGRKKPKRNKPLIMVCRNNFFDTQGRQVSTEKFQIDDILTLMGHNSKLFFWDCDRKILGNQIDWVKSVIDDMPDVIILSSYHEENFTHPRLFLVNKIRKKFGIKIVGMWHDSCVENFVKINLKYLHIFDLNAFNDNPCKDFDGIDIDSIQGVNSIFLWPPISTRQILDKDKDIGVSFLGQIDSYRSYRKGVIIELMKSNIPGFFSVFGRHNQPSHKEYYEVIGRSKIGINFSYSTNKHQLKGRAFDIVASGALLLEQEGSPIASLFEEGKDFVSFSSKQDLIEKIEYFLHNEIERKKIADSGREKFVKSYSGEQYFINILEAIE